LGYSADNKLLDHVQITHEWIPMRDGVQLSTLIIIPKNEDGQVKKRGTLMGRSPYGPTTDQIADLFMIMNGFNAVIQDQRGTFMSQGEFSMWREDGNDGYDTIEWISKQPWSNGQVFSAGISADGCGSAAMLLTAPPGLKGQLLMWNTANGHETAYPGGIFREGLVTGWMGIMAPLTRGVSIETTLPKILQNERLIPLSETTQRKIDNYWAPVQMDEHLHKVAWPTVSVTAWFDIFSGHQIEMFNGIRERSSSGADAHYIIIGPLGHCMLENTDLELSVQEAQGIVNGFGLASEIFGGFDGVRGDIFKQKMKHINVYMQGSRHGGRRGKAKVGGYWSSMETWPQTLAYRLYLTQNKGLFLSTTTTTTTNHKKNSYLRTTGISTDISNAIGNGYSEFLYDPLLPQATHGGNNLIIAMLGFGCGSEDQRRVERRTDVLVFDMQDPLVEPLPMLGRMRAHLWVSTDRNDTDFHISVTDVHPDGASMQIRYGARKMKWRDSTREKSIVTKTVPGVVYHVEVDLWFTGYIVAPGHRLRVVISSANNPYYAKNDNSGQDSDILGLKYAFPARNRIHFSAEMPSHVELPVVRMEDVGRNGAF
jgi:putative CocE/NonD family hydrolase